MSIRWLSICAVLAAARAQIDHGDFGLKIEFNQTALNQTNSMLKDRSIATDHVLRGLHPDGLDDMLDHILELDRLDGDMDGDMERRLEDANIADACPPGPKGLLCRRRFALRGADECSGGRCVMCRRCDLLTPVSWPICCKNHFLCCRPIARACQSCNVTSLVPFCKDKFGRCHSDPDPETEQV